MRDLFIVNDLERLTEYGFKKPGTTSAKGWTIYTKRIGFSRAHQSIASVLLVVNPYRGTHENELVISCRCRMDPKAWDAKAWDAKAWDAKDEPVIWSFEEIGQLVSDGVVDWVESTPS